MDAGASSKVMGEFVLAPIFIYFVIFSLDGWSDLGHCLKAQVASLEALQWIGIGWYHNSESFAILIFIKQILFKYRICYENAKGFGIGRRLVKGKGGLS